ncbi:MAG: hypothetical protein OCD76_20015 [Reichenbachiella sp.]
MAQAQYFGFESQPDTFAIDVVRNLRYYNTESAEKVAYDFKNLWSTKITDDQKIEIIEICTQMNKRRLSSKPYFKYFFSLLTFSQTQAPISQEEFSIVLTMCRTAVDDYQKDEIASVFRNLTSFFARGNLYHSRYNKLTTEGGSYSIEMLEEDTPDPVDEEEAEEIEEEEFISEDELTGFEEESDDWGASDDGGWGNDNWDTNEDSWGSDESYGYIEEPVAKKKQERKVYTFEKPDLVEVALANDIDAVIEGPVIKVTGMSFKIATPYDTLTLENVDGAFLIKEQVFVGTKATLSWPSEFRGTDGAEVELKGFTFNTNQPVLKTTRAELKFPKMFDGAVPGVFHFKSGKRYKGRKKAYPKFTSLKSDVELKIPGKNVKYKGGFALFGEQMYGTSVSENMSILDVKGKDQRSFTSKSVKYVIKDSVLTADRSSLVIYHGEDSIYHPVVGMAFDATVPKLTLLKDAGDYKHTYFFSSYFKMEFQADMISWDLESDSLDVSILNAGNRIPALFESEDYFNPIRYKKMTGMYSFHPVMTVVKYARKVQDSNYNIMELIDAYGFEFDQITSAMKFLVQNGFIKFNMNSGSITVLRKSYHYVMSNTKKKDYDNILVSSLSPSGGKNATLNFKDGVMNVRGVKKVYITPDRDVYIEPNDGVLSLLEDKDIQFDGKINAGDFQYYGKGFNFLYDEYQVDMPEIDSMNIQVDFHETSREHDKTILHNHLEKTSGTLYINDPKNKAGLRKYVQYPYFVSNSEAIVYFNTLETLNGAYDRSIYFIVPPFEIDSISRDDAESIGFAGTFHSGGIVPPIDEYLRIMPDKSLGFNHKIPAEGYALYKGEGVLYDSLKMDFDGLRSNGQIDYRTTTVYSDDFIFYMDSVSAVGQRGVIQEGQMDQASYPQAVLTDFRMLWKPLKDSMYIANTAEPFQFYNATASLDGKANITAGGVYGSGTMLSRGSKSISEEFHFSQFQYSGRHSDFEILTDNPEKPAMAGEDIDLHFDLEENIANVHPEQQGVAAIRFPYAQMNTSITNAIWYLETAEVTMSKPEYIAIEDSYFYTTRKELDSLAFSATEAIYDMKSYELNIKGIPFIKVADAEVIPDNNETTILENSALQPFANARLKIDTLNGYHNLFDGDITVLSRNKFIGSATYELVNAAQDSFAIKFASFDLIEVPRGESTKLMTVSGGVITEEENVRVAPGFFYKGDVTMYADQEALEKKGYVTLDMKSLGRYDYWISYDTPGDTADVEIDLALSKTVEGEMVTAGIMEDEINSSLYMAFVRERHRPDDSYFFEAEGILSYDQDKSEFSITESQKRLNTSYKGKTFVYNDKSKEVYFEGPLDFINNIPEFNMTTAVVGNGRPDSNYYQMDAMIGFNMALDKEVIAVMTNDVQDVVERIGADVAHDNDLDLMIKLSNFIGDKEAKDYENSTLADYEPLVESGDEMIKTLMISNVELSWSSDYNAWYNTSKIGLSNLGSTDINALSDGFMEIKRDEDGEEIVHMFFQIAPSTWYFFSYEHGRLMLYSSNPDFNNLVTEHSTVAKTGFGEYTTVLGDEFEVMKFVDGFRRKYYNIDDAYDLEFPDETHVEDDSENYDTIEDADEEELEEDHADTFEEEDQNNDAQEKPKPIKEEVEDDGF